MSTDPQFPSTENLGIAVYIELQFDWKRLLSIQF